MSARGKLRTSAELIRRHQRIVRVMGATPFPSTADRCNARLHMLCLQIDHAIEFERQALARRMFYGRTTVTPSASLAAIESPE